MEKKSKAPTMVIDKDRRRARRLSVIRSQWEYWLMLLIPLTFFLLIRYWPMFGLSISFQNYRIGDPFLSPDARWVGFKWFKQLFNSPHFPRLLRNTLTLNLLSLAISFPMAILFALLLNEIQVKWVRSMTANISLLPYFISTVVIVAILFNVFSVNDGLVNNAIKKLGGEPIAFMTKAEWFRPLYIGSGIWQNMGFNAVVFTAAISGIDPNLYEAAALDGSTRVKNIFYITIPCILPTIITMFLLRIGQLMSVGYEKIILMYSSGIYEVSDVFSTYAYRAGMESGKHSLSAAISFMNGVCNLFLITTANKVTKKLAETSLW